MKHVQTRFGKIAYEERGEGMPLVLLHANPGSRHDFDSIIPALSQRYRTIAVDWLGYGDSDDFAAPAAASAMQMAGVLEELVDALGLEKAIFMGNSMGGFAAARLAITQPEHVAGLILIDSGGFTEYSLFARLFCRLKGSEWFTRRFETQFAQYYLRKRNDFVKAILARTDAERSNPAWVATNAAIWRSFVDPDHDLRSRAHLIQAPTLLIWGRNDPVIRTAEGRTAEHLIPGARMVVLEAGHMGFAEAPDAFLAAVLPFLEGIHVASHAQRPA